jgi:inner membrane protein
MPSPIAHAAAGYAVYKVCETYFPERAAARVGPVPQLLLATIGLSLVPDLDFLPGLLVNDLGRYHNHFSHSFLFGVPVALAVGFIAWPRNRADFTFWFGLALVCYQLHVIMDFFTVGRGLMLFWPFSLERHQPPFMLFYGLHRSDGWVSIRHLWTFLTESAFAFVVVFLSRWVFTGVKEDNAYAKSDG